MRNAILPLRRSGLVLAAAFTAACGASRSPAAGTSTMQVGTVKLPAATVTADSLRDAKAVVATMNAFFDGMRTRDTALMRKQVMNDAKLNSVGGPKGIGAPLEINQFIAAVGKSSGPAYNEQIIEPEVRVDGPFASIWTRYTFSLDDKLQHCGVDGAHLQKVDGAWKILFLTDSRRTENCPAGTSQADTAQVRAAAQRFLGALIAKDTAAVTATTTPGFRYFAINAETNQQRWVEGEAFRAMLTQKGPALDERLGPAVVRIDGPLAEVWAGYTFKNDGVFSHCGADAFYLAKIGADWKVFHLGYDTRKSNCTDRRYQPR